MSDDEFDNLPDLFSGVSETEWSRILDQPTTPPASNHHSQPQQPDPPRGGRPTSSSSNSAGSPQSTDYGDDSSLDENALAELDRIETHALQTGGGPSSATRGTGRFFIRKGASLCM